MVHITMVPSVFQSCVLSRHRTYVRLVRSMLDGRTAYCCIPASLASSLRKQVLQYASREHSWGWQLQQQDFYRLSCRPHCASPSTAATIPSCTTAYGQVMSAQANFVRVRLDRLEIGGSDTVLVKQELLCVVRAVLKKMKRTVVVGDKVRVVGIDWVDGRGMVEEVFPRSSFLCDPTIANVDHIALVFALDMPPFEPANVTRYLVSAEAADIAFTVVLNKADLVPQEQSNKIIKQVTDWGYQPIAVSVKTGQGIEQLQQRLHQRVSVLAGPSGVGKSSVINALWMPALKHTHNTVEDDGGSGGATSNALDTSVHHSACSTSNGTALHDGQRSDDESSSSNSNGEAVAGEESHDIEFKLQAVGGLSQMGRGKHTTRNVTLLPLPGGGVVADTPGFNQPDINFDPADLADCFPEVRARLAESSCAFSDCSHMHEPGCAVGSDWERYAFYCQLYQLLMEVKHTEKMRATSKKKREGNVRYKSKAGGIMSAEIRLETKSHRRLSRRSAKQHVADAVQDDLHEE